MMSSRSDERSGGSGEPGSDKENASTENSESDSESGRPVLEREESASSYEYDEFEARPSYADFGEKGDRRFSGYNNISLSVMRKLEFEDSTIGHGIAARREPNRIKTFLRIRPVSSKIAQTGVKEVYVQENEQSLRVVGAHAKLNNPYADETKFKFTKIFGPDDSQSTVFEEVVKPVVESFLQGENCLIFSYGATNSGKTYTMQGSGKQFGMLPRTLEYLYNFLDDRVYTVGNIKPTFFNTFQQLGEAETKAIETAKKRILQSVKNKNIEEMTSFRASVRSNASSAGGNSNVVLIDHISNNHPNASMSNYEPNTALHAVWVSFAEIYNDRVYDLFDPVVKGKKRKELKVLTDRRGRVHLKDLTEVCANNASEAFQLFLAGKNNLQFAVTQANSNSSRSHSFFNLKMIFVGVADRVAYPKQVVQMSFCDLAGIERVAQTGNVGLRLKESGSINSSLFVLIKLIRAMRKQQRAEKSSAEILPIRESKLTKLFHGYLSSASHTSMIVNINPDPSMLETSFQVLQNSAVASEVITCQRVEAPVRSSSSFYDRVRDSIIQTNQMRRELDSTLCLEDIPEDIPEGSPEYAMPTVVAKPKFVEEDPRQKVPRLEAKIAKLEDEVRNIEDRTRKEMLESFTKMQEEYEASQRELWKKKEEGISVLNNRRVSLAAHIWNSGRATEDKQVGTSPISSRPISSPVQGSSGNQNIPCTPENNAVDFRVEWRQLMTKNYELENELQDLKASCKGLQDCISAQNATVATLQTQKGDLEARLLEDKANYMRLLQLKDKEIEQVKLKEPGKRNDSTLAQISELNEELQKKNDLIMQLQGELDEGKELCVEYNTKLEEANEKITSLSIDINRLYEENKTLQEDNEILHFALDEQAKKAETEKNQGGKSLNKRSTRRKPNL